MECACTLWLMLNAVHRKKKKSGLASFRVDAVLSMHTAGRDWTRRESTLYMVHGNIARTSGKLTQNPIKFEMHFVFDHNNHMYLPTQSSNESGTLSQVFPICTGWVKHFFSYEVCVCIYAPTIASLPPPPQQKQTNLHPTAYVSAFNGIGAIEKWRFLVE